MRIPRNIEWRAGVALVGVAMILLSLLIVLTLTRTDVGLEVEGVMSRTRRGWILTAEVHGERLDLLRQCEYVRVRAGERKVWYGRISGISGQLTQEGLSVLAQIEVREENVPYTFTGPSQSVQVMLLEERNAPILRVLLESIFNHQRN